MRGIRTILVKMRIFVRPNGSMRTSAVTNDPVSNQNICS